MADRYEMPPEGFELETATPSAPVAPASSGRYAKPPEGFELEPLPGTAVPKPTVVTTAPQKDLTMGEVGSLAYKNIIPSAKKAAGEMVEMVTSPLETAKGIGSLASGLGAKAARVAGRPELWEDPTGEKAVEAVRDFYVDRYGSLENAKRAFAEDPVGVAMDASTALGGLGGAGRAAGRLAGLRGLEAAGEAAGVVGRAIDPVATAARAVKDATPLIAQGIGAPLFSLKTGKSLEGLGTAAKAGASFNEEFLRHLTGAADPEEAVGTFRNAMKQIHDDRRNAYLSSSQGWKSNQTPLTLLAPSAEYSNLLKQYTTSGGDVAKSMKKPLSEIEGLLTYYDNSKKTMSDLDLLKQDLDDLYHNKKFKSAKAKQALTAVRSKVWQTIANHDPAYAKIMSKYESDTKEIQDILSKVGTDRSSAATKLKNLIKSQSTGTLARLAEKEPKLPYMVAGQELGTWYPGGVRGALMSTFGGLGVAGAGALTGGPLGALAGIPLAAASVPRIAGGIQYGIGAAGALPSAIEKQPISRAVRRGVTALEKPELEEEPRTERASGGRVTTAEMMLSRSKIARKKRQAQTKAILDTPDEHVVHALKIASHTLNESDHGQ